MIKYSENLELINEFLKYFNTSLKEINIFQKFMFYSIEKEVGFLDYSLIYDRIEINYIYVDEKYRRKNIASKMIDELLIIAKNNKCINISLEVNIKNKSAINFYKKMGFKKAALRENYYNGNDGILMVREMV